MRIIVAPDKFKGSLSAPEVCQYLEIGLKTVLADVTVERIPVADGGEGTLDAAVGSGFTRRTVTVSGPTGEPLAADFAVRGQEAVIEMALASGLAVLPQDQLEPLRSSSRGTGELILAALDAGATAITLGVGGSACTDGGAGLISALGVRLLDCDGRRLADGGGFLERLWDMDFSSLDPRVAKTKFVLASDVDNPLLGPEGAAAVFGPQKGASSSDIDLLEKGLERLYRGVSNHLGTDGVTHMEAPGSGAAGGVGYAALTVLGAERRPGIDVILDFTALPQRLDGADLVITGEGSLDAQSLGGKAPMGVALSAAAANVPIIAVCGRTTLTLSQLVGAGFHSVYALTEIEPDVSVCMAEAGRLLIEVGSRIGTEFAALAQSVEPTHA
ncbi:glycerate kinase [Arthrobacter sp. 35W]|uniref:glycerate kinase n=1 Tax=Arthrobacter sp. 35W TaxID=1132441 RepID=UPI0004230B56|nr:glycerate kinase [Arthrobacter sp. 35W]